MAALKFLPCSAPLARGKGLYCNTFAPLYPAYHRIAIPPSASIVAASAPRTSLRLSSKGSLTLPVLSLHKLLYSSLSSPAAASSPLSLAAILSVAVCWFLNVGKMARTLSASAEEEGSADSCDWTASREALYTAKRRASSSAFRRKKLNERMSACGHSNRPLGRAEREQLTLVEMQDEACFPARLDALAAVAPPADSGPVRRRNLGPAAAAVRLLHHRRHRYCFAPAAPARYPQFEQLSPYPVNSAQSGCGGLALPARPARGGSRAQRTRQTACAAGHWSARSRCREKGRKKKMPRTADVGRKGSHISRVDLGCAFCKTSRRSSLIVSRLLCYLQESEMALTRCPRSSSALVRADPRILCSL